MLVFLITLIDQLIKFAIVSTNCDITVIPNILSISFVKNTGGVFGMLEGYNYVFIIITTAILIALGIYVFKKEKDNKLKFILWQLILAGGISNLIDRIFRGYVVDFIDVKFFSVFNLADSFIVVSICLIIFLELKEFLSGRNKISNNGK